MKAIVLFLFLFPLFFCAAAQDLDSDTTKLDSLITIGSKDDRSMLVTSKNLNNILGAYQYKIGGSALKDGRAFSQNATISEKSLTFNAAIKPFKNIMFFMQPQLSLASNEGFVNIFKENKISNLTTGGINFTAFRRSGIGYTNVDRIRFHNILRGTKASFKSTFTARQQHYLSMVKETIGYLENSKVYNYFRNDTSVNVDYGDSVLLQNIKGVEKNIKSLVSIGLLNKTMIENGPDRLLKELKILCDKDVHRRLFVEYIKLTDSLQQNQSTTKTIKWFSWGILYNSQKVKILNRPDLTKPEDFLNEYVTLSFGFNYQIISKNGFNVYVGPKITYSSKRNFKEDSIINLSIQSPANFGALSGNQTVKSYSFYSQIAERLKTFNLELPLVFYNPKLNFGFELALRGGVANPDGDNLGARFGVFVPVGQNEEGAIVVEPLVRLSKLYSNGTHKFWEDNFSLGINVSISLPKLSK